MRAHSPDKASFCFPASLITYFILLAVLPYFQEIMIAENVVHNPPPKIATGTGFTSNLRNFVDAWSVITRIRIDCMKSRRRRVL